MSSPVSPCVCARCVQLSSRSRTREEEEALPVADGRLEAEHARELGHGLHHEHAGHDGPLREVARELRLVGRDLRRGERWGEMRRDHRPNTGRIRSR